MATPTLRSVKMKLKETLAGLLNIYSFVKDLKESDVLSVSHIKVRLDDLDRLWEKFNATLVEIKAHAEYPEETSDHYANERVTASNYYYEGKALLMERLRDLEYLNSTEQLTRAEISMNPTVEHVRLPQLTIPKFSGEYDKWLNFRDLFLSLIHWKTDLPDIEKFHYLKGSLLGKPSTMVGQLKVTAANYPLAWEMLLKEYNDNKQLVKRQVQTLFSIPFLAEESALQLQALSQKFEQAVQTLDQVSQPADYKDFLLIQLLTTRFDATTRRAWEEYSSTKEKETLDDLMEFLQRRIRILEAMPPKTVDTRNVQQSFTKPKVQKVKGSYSNVQTSPGRCVACPESHFLHTCPAFQGLTVSDREALLRKHSLCRNCLKPNHQAKKCRSRFNCRVCSGRHHTLVCFKSDNNTGESMTTNEATIAETTMITPRRTPSEVDRAIDQVSASHSAQHSTSKVLLATAVVLLEGAGGTAVQARALLDSGSECNFITENMCQLLRATRSKTVITVQGIGRSTTTVKHKVQATVRSRVTDFAQRMSFLVLPKVTVDLPTSTINTQGWILPNGIQLADPDFFASNKVDVVLGIESFFDFFHSEHKIPLGEKLPALISTVFGWVVCGSMDVPEASTHISCNCSVSVSLEELMSRFWACEVIENDNNYSKEERYCEAQFKGTVRRAVDGRYIVSLPKDEDAISRLGESHEIAVRRLLATERRLSRDENLRKQYHSFMEEYLQLGHMRKVQDTSVRRCYLPHHPVVKEASTTTKVRVVFDASCRTSTGISLNDALFAGPIVQEDLRSIILRCRIKQIMIVADAEKMFRQIVVCPEDCHLQSILWRFSPADPIDTYELSTVTYGTKSAPFLATRVLKQLADDEGKRFPLAAKTVNEDVYMDDVITGTDSVESAVRLRTELDQMLTSGGFHLRKWASNCPAVLEDIPAENLAIPDQEGIDLDPDPSVSTLGLVWMPKTDQFKFKFQVPALDDSEQWTKRKVLSVIASLFDPLGHLGPVIVKAKIFMQRLWRLGVDSKLNWDEVVPQDFAEQWEAFYKELHLLQDITFPRCVTLPDAESTELHCFSDASSEAYGCCIYLRSCNAAGEVAINLLASKSKVAPLKTQSIPRLELCAALEVVELYVKVKKALKIPISCCYFWTDSTCVLRWLQSVPNTWTTFVANRVSKIQILSEGCVWRHVPGKVNPADMISRGISPAEIIQNSVWWKGPAWLINPEDWPEFDALVLDAEEVERRNVAAAAFYSPLTEFNVEFISKFPTYNDLVRRTAYWLRLMDLLKKPKDNRKDDSFLSIAELKRAENTIIRRVQQETFQDEWKALMTGQPLQLRSPLRWYNPFICEQDNVLRIGGRLAHSQESEFTKHPVILPARHPLTRKLMQHYHEKLLHAGPQLMLAAIRQRFWPLGGRSVARQIVHNCVKCYRTKPSTVQQFMGELPAARVTVSRPFSRTGVDYFGPVYVRPGPRRVAVKAYVALFVCLCTKAVHMELVTDLSTEQFLQSLRRFISRRGCPSDLFSDNGTNFVGARNLMKSFLSLLKDRDHREAVSKECTRNGIQWHFTPPAGPHFGGLWEAAVKSAKQHILKVIGETVLSFEDMNTLIIQIEACLNSRPLTQLTEDPDDLEPLTPGHFLTGSSLQSLPEPDFSKEPLNRLKRWQVVQRHLQHFWSRWKREYLSQLQGRMKRWRPPVKIDVGQLVVIQDERLPPLRWKMGRIHQLHPGDDDVVRVVTLKTATGFMDRPVEKICILPVAEIGEVL